MEVNFLFNIGDFVTMKGYALRTGDRLADMTTGPAMQILGREVDECPGGIQKKYRVRILMAEIGGRRGFAKDLWVLHEEELVPYKEPDIKANA